MGSMDLMLMARRFQKEFSNHYRLSIGLQNWSPREILMHIIMVWIYYKFLILLIVLPILHQAIKKMQECLYLLLNHLHLSNSWILLANLINQIALYFSKILPKLIKNSFLNLRYQFYFLNLILEHTECIIQSSKLKKEIYSFLRYII